MLKENEHQEKIISTIFKEITKNRSLCQLQKQTTQVTDIQEEEIIMSRNLPYIKGTNEKLRCILRCHKVRSTFYTETALRKLLCKLKDRVDNNDVVYEIDCSKCKAAYFGESKRSLKLRLDFNTKDLSVIAIVKIMKV